MINLAGETNSVTKWNRNWNGKIQWERKTNRGINKQIKSCDRWTGYNNSGNAARGMLPHRQPIAKRRLCNQQPRISTNGVRRLIQFFVSFVLPVGKSTIISSLSFLLAFLLSSPLPSMLSFDFPFIFIFFFFFSFFLFISFFLNR